MSRIVAIDYGKKRVGIAATDVLQLTANPVGTYSPDEAIAFLDIYIAKEPVEIIVVGMPVNLNGRPSEVAPLALNFKNRIKNRYPSVTVEEYDERFTSKMAQQAILAMGVKKMDRRDKSLVDRVSACIILQSYMESRAIRQSRL
ncbi:MAG: Holliday junction resolvase RuvX [Prevotellaceae bacterium]|nr:Holliday junction resolvase RuvX [Prevotellaceae bacterium]